MAFSPVVSKADMVPTFLPSMPEQDVEDGLFSQMASLLQYSVKGGNDHGLLPGNIDDQDLKEQYYCDKFSFMPLDAQKHIAHCKGNIQGLVFSKYYYKGCIFPGSGSIHIMTVRLMGQRVCCGLTGQARQQVVTMKGTLMEGLFWSSMCMRSVTS